MAMKYRNNPHEILPRCLDISSQPARNQTMAAILQDIVDAPPDVDFEILPLCGGMTNQLFKVSPRDKSVWNETYVVRIFGEGTDLYIDRERENIVFASLAERGLAPPFVGLFQNGRVEGFLVARSLELEEFPCPNIQPHIASAMAQLHATSVDIDKNVGLWSKLADFFGLARECVDSGKVAPASLRVGLGELEEEQRWLRKAISDVQLTCAAGDTPFTRGIKFGLEVVLSHNDLLTGNVLQKIDDSSVFSGPASTTHDDIHLTLIDYEYVCYNYRAFDIANHFCEYAGFEFDIENKFPSAEPTRRHFLREYVKAAVAAGGGGAMSEDAEQADFLAGLDDIVMHMTLSSHLFWGSWAVVQAGHSQIDFDYMEYANKRFDGYYYHKRIVFE